MLSTTLTVDHDCGLRGPAPTTLWTPKFHLAPLRTNPRWKDDIAHRSDVGLWLRHRTSDLPNWNATGLRLLEAAAAFGDILFPLNEVGAKKGKRAQTYDGLRDFYAQYAEGSDCERHSSYTTDPGGVTRHFRGICILTAEHSIAKYAEMAGEDRDGGELFRAIDVSATRKGDATIFDLAPPDLDRRAELQPLRKTLPNATGRLDALHRVRDRDGSHRGQNANSGADQGVRRPHATGRC